MHWIAPIEKDPASASLEKRLWDAADRLCANSGLKAQEYSGPILGLIFLRFAEVRSAAQRAKLEQAGASSRRGSRVDEPVAYHADNVLYLAPEVRFNFLLTLPEAADIGGQVNAAMRAVEKHNLQLAGVLPKTYNLFTGTLLKDEDFKAHLQTLNEEQETLNARARELEQTIAANVAGILEG